MQVTFYHDVTRRSGLEKVVKSSELNQNTAFELGRTGEKTGYENSDLKSVLYLQNVRIPRRNSKTSVKAVELSLTKHGTSNALYFYSFKM